MLVHLPNLLSPDEVRAMRVRLDETAWQDGRITAGHQSSRVKANLQLGADNPVSRELGQVVLKALEGSPLFLSAALPRHVFPPLFNRYDPGMTFGAHVDNAVRQVQGTSHRVRTDLSATVFLSDPADYDGGELVVQDTYGEHRAKPAAGDMVLYPSRSLHRVNAVTRGSRVACFFWIQSMVRGGDHREMLLELDTAIQGLSVEAADSPPVLRLTSLYHNLLREWAEL